MIDYPCVIIIIILIIFTVPLGEEEGENLGECVRVREERGFLILYFFLCFFTNFGGSRWKSILLFLASEGVKVSFFLYLLPKRGCYTKWVNGVGKSRLVWFAGVLFLMY